MTYKTMRLYYFGNEQQKEDVYFQVIIPLFNKYLKPNTYFIKRDWNGGPNYKIIFEKQKFDQYSLYKEYLNILEKEYLVSEKELLTNIISYQQLGSVIGEIERTSKDSIDKKNHLKMSVKSLDIIQMKKLYNSQGHLQLQFSSLMKLQNFVNQWGREINSLPVRERYILLMQLMLQILRYSNLEDKYSMIVYLSNSEGILAIADEYGKRRNLISKFNLLYTSLPLATLRSSKSAFLNIFNHWERLFDRIDKEISDYLQKDKLYMVGYYSKEEQYEHLQQNIQRINSDFHNQVILDSVQDITSHKIHQQFRLLINIEYQLMHMLGVTFKEKAFLCYALPRFIMEEIGSSWQDILSERKIMNET